jgi:TRAP-type C4-dicarboxylate transport system substrate-binding protein
VQMPIGQVYNALQTGLIDGVITGSSTLSDFKLDEVASSFTMGANLGRLAFYAVMGQGTYDALSDEAKAAVDAASGLEVSKSAEDAWRETANAAVATARESGDNTFVDLTPEEAQAFADAVAGVVNDYVSQVGGEAALAAMQSQ